MRSVILLRLADRAWLLAAALSAVMSLTLAYDASRPLATALLVLLAAIAALVPGRTEEGRTVPRAAEGSPSRDGLTAAGLASAVPDPLVIYDGNGIVRHVNEAARAAFGVIAEGSPVELKFRAPEMQNLIRQSRTEGATAITIDYAERVPVERWYRVAATPVGRGSDLVVLNFRDQSETRRIDRMRADFIANASHELRTPLASVSGFIETLRGPAQDDAAARDAFLKIMHEQTARMARLIDDLLSLSRLEMKSYLRPGETVDLAAVLRSVVGSLDHLARESGVTIDHNAADAPIEVAGHRDELIQVFENLLENAIKYGQAGKRIEVQVEQLRDTADGEIRVTVRDFGPGIPAEHIPRVTERFYRVDVESSRARKGTGLGLSIVKHILTRHNGRLSIRSEEGKGAAFTVHLPRPSKAAG